jgi:hypothetical protein
MNAVHVRAGPIEVLFIPTVRLEFIAPHTTQRFTPLYDPSYSRSCEYFEYTFVAGPRIEKRTWVIGSSPRPQKNNFDCALITHRVKERGISTEKAV